jgi:hypothetical protein
MFGMSPEQQIKHNELVDPSFQIISISDIEAA